MTFLQLPKTDGSIWGGGAINLPKVGADIEVKSPRGDHEIATEDMKLDADCKSYGFGMKV